MFSFMSSQPPLINKMQKGYFRNINLTFSMKGFDLNIMKSLNKVHCRTVILISAHTIVN
jgi:hypothetical protein